MKIVILEANDWLILEANDRFIGLRLQLLAIMVDAWKNKSMDRLNPISSHAVTSYMPDKISYNVVNSYRVFYSTVNSDTRLSFQYSCCQVKGEVISSVVEIIGKRKC